jgi:hypothetical protein
MDGSESEMSIPKSNVLIYYTEDGSKYVLDQVELNQRSNFTLVSNTTLEAVEDFVKVQEVLDEKNKNIIASMQLN